MNNILNDVWYPMTNYPDYMITKDGKVKSLKRKDENILKQYKDNHEHVRVDIVNKNGQRKTTKLHRLLAETFIPNPNNLPIVRHLNDIPDDNRLENLAWGTQKDNMQDCLINGGYLKRGKKVCLFNENEEMYFDTMGDAARYLNVKSCRVRDAKYSKHKVKGYNVIETEAKMKEQDDLKALVDEMYSKKQIKRFSITYHSIAKKYAVWIEFPDGNATTFSVNNAEELKSEMAKALPVKKSWKCHICRYYLKNCDGCKKGFYNSIFIPCPDWKGPEYQPTDKDLCNCLKTLISEATQMTSPIVHIHKGADWIMSYILELVGYDLTLYNKVPKGYEEDPDNYIDTFESTISWQCILCRGYDYRELHCRGGLDEGWVHENHCPSFIHVENAIDNKFFKYIMDIIYREREDNELSWEAVHYNMDRFMSYVIESLGYFEFAKMYRKLELQYLEIPF